jgi:hypothetical protein
LQVGAQAGGAHFPLLQLPDPQSLGLPVLPQSFPSGQFGAQAGALQVPPVQTPDAQSELSVHPCPSLQLPVPAQPVPLLTHLPFVQWVDAQSEPRPQSAPSAHPPPPPPPRHAGSAHVPFVQTPEPQS